MPVRKLTDVGGQFPAWSADGRRAHWSIGNAHFIYDLDDAAAAAEAARAAEAAEAEEEAPRRRDRGRPPPTSRSRIRVAVDAIRDIPNGYGVLRGGRVVTMRGNEVLENADVVVQGNRILGVGRRGSVEFPDFARVIEVPGTTIVPGFVDTHAHMRPSFGVHKTQPWTYLANLAYGVTTTRDPADRHHRRPDLRRPRGDRRHRRPANLLDRTGRLQRGADRGSRPRAAHPAALQRVLRHPDHQDVHVGQPPAAPVDRDGGEGAGAAADHRRRPRHEVRPGDDHRRLPGAGALVPHLPALPRCRQPRRPHPHGLHADAARLLRRTVRRELVLHAREPARRSKAAAVHPARRARPPHTPARGRGRRGAGRLVPRGGVRLPAARRGG